MCEANVYLRSPEDGEEVLIMEAVDQLIPEGPDQWRLTSIFGEQKLLAGRILSLNLVDHRVIFESVSG